jgi:hypothetical protein
MMADPETPLKPEPGKPVPPEMTDEDESILDAIWDNLATEDESKT